MEQNLSPPNRDFPQGEIVFMDQSEDCELTMVVKRDPGPHTDLMEQIGDMGEISILDTATGEVYHKERLPLSRDAIFGGGPLEDEAKRWFNILNLFSF